MYNNLDNNINTFKSSLVNKLISEKEALINDLKNENKSLKTKINYLLSQIKQLNKTYNNTYTDEINKIKSELFELKNKVPIQNIIYTSCSNCSPSNIKLPSFSESNVPIAPPAPPSTSLTSTSSTPSNNSNTNLINRSATDTKTESYGHAGSYYGGRSLIVPHEHKDSNINNSSVSYETNLSVKDVLKNISSKKGSGNMADVLEQLKNAIKSRNQ